MIEKDYVDRIITAAGRDQKIAKKLRELEQVDNMLPRALSAHEVKTSLETSAERITRTENLCNEIASAVANSKQEAEEIAEWLSWYVSRVVAELLKRRGSE